jgi:WD40 repeat protein
MTGGVLSPDGTTLAIATGNKVIRLLDVATGKEARQITLPQFGLSQLSYTADGKAFVARTANSQFQVLDLDGKVLASSDTGQNRPGVSFIVSADGKVIAAGAELGRDKTKPSAWDVKTGKQLGPFEAAARPGRARGSVRRRQVLATWGRSAPRIGGPERPEDMETNQTVQLWNTTTGKELTRLKGDPSNFVVTGVAVSSDGKLVAVANGQATVTLWDAAGKPLRKVAGRRGIGAHMTFSPDNKTLIAATPDGTTVQQETATGKRSVSASCGAFWALCSAEKPPRAYGIEGQALCLGTTGRRGADADRPPGGGVSRGHRTRTASRCGPRDGWPAVPVGPGHGLRAAPSSFATTTNRGFSVSCTVFSPDARHLLSGSGMRLWAWQWTGRLRLRQPRLRRAQALRASPMAASGRLRRHPAIRLNRRRSGCGTWPAGRHPRTARARGDVHRSSSPADIAASALLRPGRRRRQVAEINVWDAAAANRSRVVRRRGSLPGRVHARRQAVVLAARIAPSACSRQTAARCTIDVDYPYPPLPVVFSPDGRMLAVATSVNTPDGRSLGMQVSLFEAATGLLRCTLEGHDGPIAALAFSRDGRVLATGGNDTTVLLWDLTGKLRQEREGALAGKWAEEAWEDLDSPQAEKKAYRGCSGWRLAPKSRSAVEEAPVARRRRTWAKTTSSG